jgi:hypothetical protein
MPQPLHAPRAGRQTTGWTAAQQRPPPSGRAAAAIAVPPPGAFFRSVLRESGVTANQPVEVRARAGQRRDQLGNGAGGAANLGGARPRRRHQAGRARARRGLLRWRPRPPTRRRSTAARPGAARSPLARTSAELDSGSEADPPQSAAAIARRGLAMTAGPGPPWPGGSSGSQRSPDPVLRRSASGGQPADAQQLPTCPPPHVVFLWPR